MFINCTEKCTYQKDGICIKNDCSSQNEYISGNVSCPHFEPKSEQNPNNSSKYQLTSEDQRHFSKV